MQYIASVTSTHDVSFVDVAGPTTECSSAVNASIPVEPSTSSGCLYSQGIDDNEVTFDCPVEELQMQDKEPNTSKHTSEVGFQVNTQGVQVMMKSSETQTYR